ncbi:MAG TPA: hypothetical protein VMI06_05940 [Terriglobia bacterium]|nr:hypothetical protein [Terriglobia bacterium]
MECQRPGCCFRGSYAASRVRKIIASRHRRRHFVEDALIPWSCASKVGVWTTPASRFLLFAVVIAGSRHLHAVSTGFSYADERGSFQVETLDAPLIALAKKSPLNLSRSQPDLGRGIHCGLFDNGRGTNYIMWFSENMRFRFQLRA